MPPILVMVNSLPLQKSPILGMVNSLVKYNFAKILLSY